MCKIGDIVVIDGYMSDGKMLGKHSFVIINDEHGQIEGLDYDIVCNVMSSFKSEKQKAKKLRYPGNFPITCVDENLTVNGNQKSGYIKAEQLYFFCKQKTNYVVIGSLTPEFFEELMKFIENLNEYTKEFDNL